MRILCSLLTLLALAATEVVADPSPGCGRAPTKLKNGLNTITVSGVPRTFALHIPDNYENKTPYRAIFVFHGTGGTANGTSKTYDGLLSQAGGTSILVAPQGLGPTAGGGKASGIIGALAKGMSGWWHTGGKYGLEDIEFVDKMVEALDVDLCVDTKLRFSTGFSFGGVMSYSLACLRADKFRAVSVLSGAKFDSVISGMSASNKGDGKGGLSSVKAPGTCKKTDSFSSTYMGIDPSKFLDQMLLGDKKAGAPFVCGTKAVPYMAFMGVCDGWIQYGREARDDFLKNNDCKPKQYEIPAEGSKKRVQTTYDCAVPVVWTEFDGGHQPGPGAPADTWKFFSQFK